MTARGTAAALLVLALLGCQEAWQAQGGEASLTVTGSLPWTEEETVQTEVTVVGENREDVAISCGVLKGGSYEVAVFTTFVEELKRLRATVTVDRYYGSSGYGTDADPSGASAQLTFRQEGEEGWFSEEARSFPCDGFIDEEQLRGEFSCAGITGGTSADPDADGPIGFTLTYLCGRGSDLEQDEGS